MSEPHSLTTSPDTHRRGKLSRRTLINMALRVAGVTLVSVGVSYLHVMSSLEMQTKKQLSKYILERGQRESTVFQLAEDNLTFLKNQILDQLKQPSDRDFTAEFDRLHFRWSDGTLRNAPQTQPISSFDTAHYPTTFIPPKTEVDADDKRLVMTAYDLIRSYGPAWSVRFLDTYFCTTDGANVLYWKGVPFSLLMPADMDATQQEFFSRADQLHNPQRKPIWTGVYLDPNVKIWMVSASVPIDDASGKFLGTVAHDITLTDLLKQTVEDRLPGTYNLIFRADGRLIVHPELMSQIHQAQGNLSIVQTRDAHLQRIFQQVTRSTETTGVLENSKDQEYLAFTQLSATGWYFVTVYPKSLLAGTAFDTVKFFLMAGAIALLVEVWLLFLVLQQQVTHPLKRLITASNRLATGDFQIQLDTTRRDELGELATSFISMAHQLDRSFQQLAQVNSDLEQRIGDRTVELQEALDHLQRTQLHMVQSEKMSALGQMVAGVAHEINNPVSFIHGNINHIDEYTQDLLKLIQLYQTECHHPSPDIQSHLDLIDLEFLRKDLKKILHSVQQGTNRIREIVLSLRNFSRLDEAELKIVNLHDGIDNTLLILRHRCEETVDSPGIKIIKEYGDLPLVECYPGQLNQVFMNILTNSIDAIKDSYQYQTDRKNIQDKNNQNSNTILIHTDLIDQDTVRIIILDNGIGIKEDIKADIFNPFFTTKPVGQGTGLGLSISYQIVVDRHHGQLYCDSTMGKGTKFVIEIPIYQSQNK